MSGRQATTGAEMNLASRALYRHRQAVVANAARLRALFEAVGRGGDLSLPQWCHLYTLALEVRPDLIIELGRGRGNSTCVFTQAAQEIPGCRVLSYCIADDWDRLTRPKIARLVPKAWFEPLDARLEDIAAVDFEAACEGARRVLVFWDAHGFAVADCVLARLMPVIADRPHVVAMHDITDSRYCGSPAGYERRPFWRGQETGWAGDCAPLRLGWVETVVDQVIPTLDFLARNGLELQSADHDLHCDIVGRPERQAELERDYPEGFFATVNHWAYFSLSDAPGPYHFPAYGGAGDREDAPPSGEAATDAVLPPVPDVPLASLSAYAQLGRALCRDLDRHRLFGWPTPLTWVRVLAKAVLGRYRRPSGRAAEPPDDG